MKKTILTKAACVVAALISFSCGNNGAKNSAVKNKPLEIAIWDNNQEPGISAIIADFTEKTGIRASVQVIPWDSYWTLLESGARGGDLPDVFWMHSNYSQKFMANGLLLDITERFAQSEAVHLSDYYEDITALYQYDGKTYAVPKDYDTIALWYNKKMFDDASLSYPDETWTWQTLADAAKRLTKYDGSCYGFASPAANNQDGYYNIIYDFGGAVLSKDKKQSLWDSPATLSAMKWWFSNLLPCMPPQQTMAENTADVLFTSGKVAMIMQGSWQMPVFKNSEYALQNADVAVLPKTESGVRKSIYNGLGWAASARTAQPDNAWKLLEYLGTKEAQEKQASLGVTMSAFKNTSEKWTACAPEFNLKAYLDMASDMVIRPYSRSTKNWEDFSQQTMVKAYTGEIDIETACHDIAAYMNAELSNE